ncbi:hypothetical protein L2V44_14210, partial [Staphylococcus aureus]|nr:hypothetical protein [Staphylococcus aureus]
MESGGRVGITTSTSSSSQSIGEALKEMTEKPKDVELPESRVEETASTIPSSAADISTEDFLALPLPTAGEESVPETDVTGEEGRARSAGSPATVETEVLSSPEVLGERLGTTDSAKEDGSPFPGPTAKVLQVGTS